MTCPSCNGIGVVTRFFGGENAPGWEEDDCPECVKYMLVVKDIHGNSDLRFFSKFAFAWDEKEKILETRENPDTSVYIEKICIEK